MLAAAVWPDDAFGAEILHTQSFVWPDVSGLIWLVAIGVLGGIGQIVMTQSYRYADASIIAIFDYTSLLWTSALGMMFFDDVPSVHLILGACVVAGASLFVIWSEQRQLQAQSLISTSG